MLKEAFQGEKHMVQARNSDVHCIKSARFIVLKFLKGMNFLSYSSGITKMQACNKFWKTAWMGHEAVFWRFLLTRVYSISPKPAVEYKVWLTLTDRCGGSCSPLPTKACLQILDQHLAIGQHLHSASDHKLILREVRRERELKLQHYLSSYTEWRWGRRETESGPPPVAESRRRLHVVLAQL